MWNPPEHSEFCADQKPESSSPISFQSRGEKGKPKEKPKEKPKAKPKHARLGSTAHAENNRA